MKKKRAEPYRPTWDFGTGTTAQRQDLLIEDAGEIDPKTGRRVNPNGVKRARRMWPAERYRRRGWLTERQYRALELLMLAWERTGRTQSAYGRIKVDQTPNPTAAIAVQIDRRSDYHRIARWVAGPYRAYVMWVGSGGDIGAMPGYRAAYMERLRKGADALADKLGV